MSLRTVSSLVAFKKTARTTPTVAAALHFQRRHSEYWGITVTGRTQPYAQGDMLPRTHNVLSGSKTTAPNSASLTGSTHNLTYDSDSMFNVEAQLDQERFHGNAHNGVFEWRVNPIGEGDAKRVVEVFDDLLTQQGKQQEYFWDRLFKDFPSLRTPFQSSLQAEFIEFYRDACKLADSEADVAALAAPFLRRVLQEHYITAHTFWRISEKLSDAIELLTSEKNRYERRACRNVIERVTKISLNAASKEKWVHPDAVDPLQMEVGGYRAWHEAGNW